MLEKSKISALQTYLQDVELQMIKRQDYIFLQLTNDKLLAHYEKYKLEKGKKYLLYIYVDKTGRLAATTDIDKYLGEIENPELGSEVSGIVYGYQTNGSLRVALDGQYRAVVLKNEYFTDIKPGEEIKGRIKRVYDDGIVGLSIRNTKLVERDELSTKILEYLKS